MAKNRQRIDLYLIIDSCIMQLNALNKKCYNINV